MLLFDIPAKVDFAKGKALDLEQNGAVLGYDVSIKGTSEWKDCAGADVIIVTAGVPLNHLVDKEFTVGEARFRGVRLCEPCSHMESLSRPGARKALLHRGGLNAEILESGTIRPGDPVSPA